MLVGGRGSDSLFGGAGADVYRFSAGDSGQSLASMDYVFDFNLGLDRIAFESPLRIGGNAAAASASQASINAATGIATFAQGSGGRLPDALSDIARRFTAAADAFGEFALFQVGNSGPFHLFISDGVAGVTADDVLIQLSNITSLSSVSISGDGLTLIL